MTRYCNSSYHGFFDAGDDRSRLTWRGRFADVSMLTDMYNFYSSGDEVLEIGPQGITVLDWDASVRQYTWHKQEAKPLSLEETLWLRISHELYPEGLEYDLMRRAETNDTRAARRLDVLPWRSLDSNYEIIGNSVKREECDNGNK